MSAKVFLRRLTDMSTFNTLQEKLSRLNDTYLVRRSTSWLMIILDVLVEFMWNECFPMYWYNWIECACSTRIVQTSQSCLSWRFVIFISFPLIQWKCPRSIRHLYVSRSIHFTCSIRIVIMRDMSEVMQSATIFLSFNKHAHRFLSF